MRVIVIIFFVVGIINSTIGQKVKKIKNESFLAIEEFTVLKSDKKVRNGTYIKKWKYDGEIIIHGNYKENRRIGIWEFYDFRTKKLEQKYDYDKNELVYSEPSAIDRTPSNNFYYNGEWILDELDTLPVLVGGISDLKLKLTELVYDYTKAPGFPTAGVTIFSFIVTKDGKTKDYKIVHSSGNSFENDLLKYLEEYNGIWIPATYKGEHVDSELLIPMNVRYKENTQGIKRFTIDFNNAF